MTRNRKLTLVGIVAIILFIVAAAAAFRYNLAQTIMTAINQNTPLPLFIALMLVLPFTGFPISVFFVMAGLKFGIITGLAITALTMPVHFTGSFFLARALRGPLNRLLSARNYRIPDIPAQREFGFCFLVAALPASYAVKNYLMPLAGVSFKSYFWISWPVQLALATPFVILGESAAHTNPAHLGAAILGFALLYLVIRRLEKRFGHAISPEQTEKKTP